MSIKIVTEKMTKDKIRGRKIISLECLAKEELPREYVHTEEEFVSSECHNLRYCLVTASGRLFTTGTFIDELDFQQKLDYIKKAGENLHKINHSWKGQETFEI